MIPIKNGESKLSFFEFSLEIPKDLIHAFQTYAKVRNGRLERTRKEWLDLYSSMLTKPTK